MDLLNTAFTAEDASNDISTTSGTDEGAFSDESTAGSGCQVISVTSAAQTGLLSIVLKFLHCIV